MEAGGREQGSGRGFVIVLVLLCVACGIWMAVSAYRRNQASIRLSRTEKQLDEVLPIGAEIVKLRGTRTQLEPLSDNELGSLIDAALASSALDWRSVIPLPPHKVGQTTEVVTTIEMKENDITRIVDFLVAVKTARPDLLVSRVNVTSVNRSKRNWTGSMDIKMVRQQ